MMRFARAAAQEVAGTVTSISLVILSSVECEQCSLFFLPFWEKETVQGRLIAHCGGLKRKICY